MLTSELGTADGASVPMPGHVSRHVSGALRAFTAFADACGDVWGTSDAILQAIINLCVDASHALRSAGSRLRSKLQSTYVHASLAERHTIAHGPALRVVVEYGGAGIAPHGRACIFEPIFVTKPPAQGSGVGLFPVQATTYRHGGHVLARSTARAALGSSCSDHDERR